ncbi:MAG: hypothetical protein ACI4V1_08675 [Eubacteriales bacterium]
MKKRISYDLAVRIAVPVLFVVLCILTILTIVTITGSNSEEALFDLAGLTNETRREEIDVSEYLLPSFIGITAGGKRLGVSASRNLVSELYHLLTPTIYSALSDTLPMSDDIWDDHTSAENSVYIKFHSELPDGIIALFAGLSLGEEEPTVRFDTGIYEMFILPYTSGTSETILVTRSGAGEIRKYAIPNHETSVSVNELERFVRSYGSGMSEFRFNEGKYDNAAWTEPVYTDGLYTRAIIMTDGTAALIQNSAEERESLLRVFGFNPDKLLNVHEEEDGSSSYYDTQGILYLRDNSFEYVRASAESGMKVSDLLGGASSASNPLAEYVRASVLLFEGIDAINKNFSGGDADILLESASSRNGEVTLRFLYVLDNIRISGAETAYTITFSAGNVRSAVLSTIAVRVLGEREKSFTEWWFLSALDTFCRDVRLVYRSDYVSESVSAEWAAEALVSMETDVSLLNKNEAAAPESEEEHGS